MKKALSLPVCLIITATICTARDNADAVMFVLGPRHFSDGNAITIDKVSASSPNFATGDTVTVRGRYTFNSEEKAKLCLYLTTDQNVGPEAVSDTQTSQVTKGSGGFELSETLKHSGHLHLSFYGRGNKCLGTVYFGTEPQMKEISHWDVRTY